jgi:hypothetical protein
MFVELVLKSASWVWDITVVAHGPSAAVGRPEAVTVKPLVTVIMDM